MYRDGDVVAKGEVVKHIDSEEHQGTQNQSCQGESAALKEEWWTAEGEVSWPCDESCYNELDEGDEESFRDYELNLHRKEGKTQYTALWFPSDSPAISGGECRLRMK